MREWLLVVSEGVVVAIDAVALLVIVVGSLQALAGVAPLLLRDGGDRRRAVWLRYARWLVAALTFQLAADIVETAITSDWQAIARMAAIAVIRTFLEFFLERNLAEVRERQRGTSAEAGP